LTNWFEIEYYLLKQLRLQPSELDRLEFWRAETLIEIHKEKVEEDNRRKKKESEEQNAGMPNMNSFMSQQQNMYKNVTGGFKLPK
jgi:hypothetical protein